MSHALLSPSAAGRWLNCTPAPRLEATLPDNPSQYAAEGTLAHSVCELCAKKKFTLMRPSAYNAELKRLKADPLWQDEMMDTATAYVDHLTERAMEFAHTPYTTFEARVDISDYAPECYGTADCIMIGGNTLIITDYKHGKGVPVSAEQNPQMKLYALGALKLYEPIYGDRIKRVACYIDQPRLDNYSGYDISVAELRAWGDTVVKPKAALAFAGEGVFAPGDHCRFCRAKAQCRARADVHTALEEFKDMALPTPENMVQMNEDGMDGIPTPPLLTNAEIGDLLTRGKSLVDWFESLGEYALSAILSGETVPGYKAVEGTSRAAFRPDFDTAAKILVDAGYKKAVLYRKTPETLANLDKLVGGRPQLQELLGGHLYKPPGKPALVPETDKRPAYNNTAADFKDAETQF